MADWKTTPWWKFWDPRSGAIGGVIFALVVTSVTVLVCLLGLTS